MNYNQNQFSLQCHICIKTENCEFIDSYGNWKEKKAAGVLTKIVHFLQEGHFFVKAM